MERLVDVLPIAQDRGSRGLICIKPAARSIESSFVAQRSPILEMLPQSSVVPARLHESVVVGMDLRDAEIDFVALACSMGVAARRVVDPQDVAPALREAMRDDGPQLVEVMIADGFGSAAAFPAS
jgi:hypothetical protein